MGAGYGSKGGEPTDDEAMQQLNDRVRFCANNEDLKKLIDKAGLSAWPLRSNMICMHLFTA